MSGHRWTVDEEIIVLRKINYNCGNSNKSLYKILQELVIELPNRSRTAIWSKMYRIRNEKDSSK